MSELEKTTGLLQELNDEQLQVIQKVAKILVFRKPKDSAPVVSETEKPVIRKVGKYKGQIILPDDFDATLDLFREYMY